MNTEHAKGIRTTWVALVLGCLYTLTTSFGFSDAELIASRAKSVIPFVDSPADARMFAHLAPFAITLFYIYFCVILTRSVEAAIRLPPAVEKPVAIGLVDYLFTTQSREQHHEADNVAAALGALLAWMVIILPPISVALLGYRHLVLNNQWTLLLQCSCLAACILGALKVYQLYMDKGKTVEVIERSGAELSDRKDFWLAQFVDKFWDFRGKIAKAYRSLFCSRFYISLAWIMLTIALLMAAAILSSEYFCKQGRCPSGAQLFRAELSVKPRNWSGVALFRSREARRSNDYLETVLSHEELVQLEKNRRIKTLDDLVAVQPINLDRAQLRFADMRFAYAQRAQLRSADLSWVHGSYARFEFTDAARVNFSNAILRSARFDIARASRSKWIGADLRRTVLVRASLDFSDFSSTTRNCNWENQRSECCGGGAGQNKRWAGLSCARKADFRGAWMAGSKLHHVSLEKAWLHGTLLIGADLTGANMRGAEFGKFCGARHERRGRATSGKSACTPNRTMLTGANLTDVYQLASIFEDDKRRRLTPEEFQQLACGVPAKVAPSFKEYFKPCTMPSECSYIRLAGTFLRQRGIDISHCGPN